MTIVKCQGDAVGSTVQQRWWLGGILCIHAGLLAWAAVMDSPTCDEPFHLAGGIRHLQDARFDVDRGNPPLSGTIAALPVVLLAPKTEWRGIPDSFVVGRDFINNNGMESFWFITVGRWACIPLSLLGCIVCFRWARDLYGVRSGMLASLLWCFCPNLLAHGHQVTGDMAATTCFLAASYLFWKWLQQRSIGLSLAVGFAFGLAELSKYVCLLLYPVCFTIWVIWRLSRWRTCKINCIFGELGHLFLIAALSVNIINLAYLGEGSFSRLDKFRIGRKLLGADTKSTALTTTEHGLLRRSSLASLPVPLPEDYVLGVDEIQTWYRVRDEPSYMRGSWRNGGWWHYYLYGLIVKMPVGTLLIFSLACIAPLILRGGSVRWLHELTLIVPIVSILVFVTKTTMTNQSHLRYVLPVLPFLYIWASKTAKVSETGNRYLGAFVWLSVSASIASSMCVYPHSLSFFNELTGGPRYGPKQFLDSNIDWGQDLLYLNQWLMQHPDARPMHLVHEGLVDPAAVGMRYPMVPPARGWRGEDLGLPAEELGPQPGWHAVCVQQMYLKKLDYFLDFEPVALAGYSFYIFHLKCDDVNRVRDKLGIARLACDSGERD